MSDANSGTHEFVPEPDEHTAICEKCKERMSMDVLLTHLAVCQGIDITKAGEWPIVVIDDPEANDEDAS